MVLGSYFHFCLELVLETWVNALLILSLWVHKLSNTHSLASIQYSGSFNQKTLIRTKSCMKWSPYNVKVAFSMPVWPRKQSNSPPAIDPGFPKASCNSRHALPPRGVHQPPPPVPHFLLAQNLSSKRIAQTNNMPASWLHFQAFPQSSFWLLAGCKIEGLSKTRRWEGQGMRLAK